jgi:hypothetical protein
MGTLRREIRWTRVGCRSCIRRISGVKTGIRSGFSLTSGVNIPRSCKFGQVPSEFTWPNAREGWTSTGCHCQNWPFRTISDLTDRAACHVQDPPPAAFPAAAHCHRGIRTAYTSCGTRCGTRRSRLCPRNPATACKALLRMPRPGYPGRSSQTRPPLQPAPRRRLRRTGHHSHQTGT